MTLKRVGKCSGSVKKELEMNWEESEKKLKEFEERR